MPPKNKGKGKKNAGKVCFMTSQYFTTICCDFPFVFCFYTTSTHLLYQAQYTVSLRIMCCSYIIYTASHLPNTTHFIFSTFNNPSHPFITPPTTITTTTLLFNHFITKSKCSPIRMMNHKLLNNKNYNKCNKIERMSTLMLACHYT